MARRALLPPPATPRGTPAPPASGTTDRSPTVPAIAASRVIELLDRLAGADEAAFVQAWLESLAAEGPSTLAPALSVRLLRACRETGQLERARELCLQLPALNPGWQPVDAARLAIERAMLANIDGRPAAAEEARTQAARALAGAAPGAGLREQLDLHLVGAEIELRRSDVMAAARSLRLAEHVADRLEDGAYRVVVSMSLGHLAMRLGAPRGATKHYLAALDRAPSRGHAAMRAHGNVAIALGSTGALELAREHAESACAIAEALGAGWRHADAFDVLAIVEIAADRPTHAIAAIDAAFAVLGEQEQPMLRYQLSSHKAFALAAAGRVAQARTWMAKAERKRLAVAHVDAIDAQDLVATRARTLEAQLAHAEALELGSPHASALPHAFVTGTLNLVLGRCALASGREDLARACVERAALSGEEHGWVFPEREASAALYRLGLRSGDSRVVRFAARMLGASAGLDLGAEVRAEPSVYVTTAEGVACCPRSAVDTLSVRVYVDTTTHTLRVGSTTTSLERRRALEPLVAELLRRAKDGLSAEEILRAAGGPGPDSADAEHRVRVLVSRVRDLLGDANLVTRVREAGERGRLAEGTSFALVEPRA